MSAPILSVRDLGKRFGSLIAARVVQGLSAAMLTPQAFGLIRDLFPPAKMTKAFAALGPVIGLSTVAGPIVAGLLLKANLFGTDWRKAPSWVGIRKFLLQLDEHDLENAVRAFAQKQVCAPPGRQFIALDGKALRGSASRLEDMTARHIVSAFDQQGLIVLGHVEVAEKSNEIPAAQALIESAPTGVTPQ